MDDAFTEARRSGGKHHGFYKRYQQASSVFIRRAIRSLEQKIAEHEEKIRNPASISGLAERDPREQEYLVTRHWPNEIVNWQEQIAILQGILEERDERSR